MQSIANADFQVEAKFDSASPATGEQGLMAMQDTGTYVRCDLIGDGTNVNTYSAFISGTTVNNASLAATQLPVRTGCVCHARGTHGRAASRRTA